MGDIAKGIAKYVIIGVGHVVPLPTVLPILDPLACLKEGEIDRPHVKRAQLRLESHGRSEPLLDGHGGAATGRYVDDAVGLLSNLRQEAGEDLRIARGSSVFGNTRMKVHNGGARPASGN